MRCLAPNEASNKKIDAELRGLVARRRMLEPSKSAVKLCMNVVWNKSGCWGFEIKITYTTVVLRSTRRAGQGRCTWLGSGNSSPLARRE